MWFTKAIPFGVGTIAAAVVMVLSGNSPKPAPLWASMLQACQADCQQDGCALFDHYANPAPSASLGTSHSGCLSGLCFERHPPCPGFALYDKEAAGKVWFALTAGSDTEVLDVVRKYPAFIDVNTERGLIHVLNCDRTSILANIPFPKRLEASLVAADTE